MVLLARHDLTPDRVLGMTLEVVELIKQENVVALDFDYVVDVHVSSNSKICKDRVARENMAFKDHTYTITLREWV